MSNNDAEQPKFLYNSVTAFRNYIILELWNIDVHDIQTMQSHFQILKLNIHYTHSISNIYIYMYMCYAESTYPSLSYFK